MAWIGACIGVLVVCGWGLGCSYAATYRFVHTVSRVERLPSSPLPIENELLGALDTGRLKPAVRRLTAPEMAGRARGTSGNARARAYIVSRLQRSGLTPLFHGSFEQPTLGDEGGPPYAVNVGAYLPAEAPGDGWIVLVAHYDHLGIRNGTLYPGADDNASAVAMLLSVGDALAEVRSPLRRHVVLLFADAEEPPDVRTDRMGSTWFWKHPPFPLTTLHCALVFDLLAGPVHPAVRAGGLGEIFFVLGAEASAGLTRLARSVPAEPGAEPVLLGLPLIEAYPFVPWRRFAQGDYHGLREQGGRPFLFVTAGRATTYHTPGDTPDTLDYLKLARLTRWAVRLLVRTAETPGDLGWSDTVADPLADARALRRFHVSADIGGRSDFPWLLRRALVSDAARVHALVDAWENGKAPTAAEYRELTLMALRIQGALWNPAGWWLSLW